MVLNLYWNKYSKKRSLEEKLLETVRCYPYLKTKTKKNYKDKRVQENSWNEAARELEAITA